MENFVSLNDLKGVLARDFFSHIRETHAKERFPDRNKKKCSSQERNYNLDRLCSGAMADKHSKRKKSLPNQNDTNFLAIGIHCKN